MAVPNASAALEGIRLDLRIEEGKGLATWTIPQSSDDKNVLFLQAILIDAEDQERRLPSTRHPLTSPLGNPLPAAGIPWRRGPFSLMRPLLDDVHRDSILVRLNQSDAASVILALQELMHFEPGLNTQEIGNSLEKLLSNTDDAIRAHSAKLMGIWSDKTSAPAVLRLVGDSIATVRHAAMDTLAVWQIDDAVAPIAGRLLEADDRRPAKQSLIRMGARAEIKVIEFLAANELAVRLVACEILAEVGSKNASIPALKALMEQEGGLAAVRAKEAIERIITRGSQPLFLQVNVISGGNRKVHLGLPIKHGEMILTEGALILGDQGPGIGLGVVQTGSETMEFTYITLIRFPRGNSGQTTFATRRKKMKDRVSVAHSAYFGDESLAFEHAYAPDVLPFVEEEYLIQDRRFDPQNGRLFLVDITGTAPVIVQKNINMPATGSFVPINSEVVQELADRALNELIQTDEIVRSFLDGKKLVEAKGIEKN